MSSTVEQFIELKKKGEDLKARKIRLEEQAKAVEKQATELVKEIKAKGYDYKKLPEILKEKQKELDEAVQSYQEALTLAAKQIREVEEAL